MSAPSATAAANVPPLALITTSVRIHNNGDGLAAWLVSQFNTLAASRASPHSLALASSLSSLPLPYGPVEDPVISQAILPSATPAYADPAVRAWSAAVSHTPALVILTPQYNWGYPGQLKNLLDHVYHEWRGKRVVLVTYGGHGGGRCAEQLKVVLKGGLHMEVVGDVQIDLPREYIMGKERVGDGGGGEGWLGQYEGNVAAAFGKLLEGLVEVEVAF